MRKFVNGKFIELTPEEITVIQTEARKMELMEKSRKLTESEVFRMFMTAQINTLAVDDNTALRMREFYPEWEENIAYDAGFKVRSNGKLWRAIQVHTAVAGWEPENAASLWEQINESHTGTADDPIPYDGNMALVSGLYYHQNYEMYLCIRDTVNPVYATLDNLVGLYVEVI